MYINLKMFKLYVYIYYIYIYTNGVYMPVYWHM